ncbi:hypothetical protein [uncultured Parabacteroides sp.]|nr:hypothetical protein [uncultured Parabacteroides sp.]
MRCAVFSLEDGLRCHDDRLCMGGSRHSGAMKSVLTAMKTVVTETSCRNP